jgi:hypothetical protein
VFSKDNAGGFVNIVVCILMGGFVGLITGYLLGPRGYGKLLLEDYVRTLDILFGVIGASLADYLWMSAFASEKMSFVVYGMAGLASITLVGVCRLISGIYSPSASYKGMSRSAFIAWHDAFAVKELATWKPPSRESRTPTEKRRP